MRLPATDTPVGADCRQAVGWRGLPAPPPDGERRPYNRGLASVRELLLFLAASLTAVAQLPPEFRTDAAKTLIRLDELVRGGPPKDGIPALRAPKFESAESASAWLAPAEPVQVVRQAGEVRAYPLQILIWHELVNDVVGGRPILVSFCPLCNAAVVFDRSVDGAAVEFGVSGLLRNSDMIMFDRPTEPLWQQLTGEALVGEHAGGRLEIVASQVVPFRALAEAFPNARVLGRDTGHRRAYGRNPYEGYEYRSRTIFPAPYRRSASIRPMERLLAFRSGSRTLAYVLADLRERRVVSGGRRGREYVVFYEPSMVTPLGAGTIAESGAVGTAGVFSRILDGERLEFGWEGGAIVDRGTASTWNLFGQAKSGPMQGVALRPIEHGVYYAFAWLAFRPRTELVRLPER